MAGIRNSKEGAWTSGNLQGCKKEDAAARNGGFGAGPKRKELLIRGYIAVGIFLNPKQPIPAVQASKDEAKSSNSLANKTF